MVQWIMKPKDKSIKAQFAVVVHNAISEWALHGEEAYEQNKSILNNYLLHYAGKSYMFKPSYNEALADLISRATTVY